jgi:hypothetical protein
MKKSFPLPQMASQQVLASMVAYTPSNLKAKLTKEQLASVQVKKLNVKGVRYTDNVRDEMQNQLAKDKAER